MQGAGEGRELSITFQTSGKAVRLGAPEKWRKAIVGEDLKPDTWVEIHRQGGSPRTVRADQVPELHAIFVDLGLAPEASPAPVTDDTHIPAEAADDADAAPGVEPPPGVVGAPTGFDGPQGLATRSAYTPPPTPGGRRNERRVAALVVGLVFLGIVLRTCGRPAQHADTSGLDSGQLSIAVDSSAPAPSSVPTPAESAVQPPTDAGQPALASEAPPAQPAAGPLANFWAGYYGVDPSALQTAEGPSFDCGRVLSENLKLICATPDLAGADRAMAAAYQRALASSDDSTTLRDSQRAWIVARDAVPADLNQLRTLYADRLRFLRNQPGLVR